MPCECEKGVPGGGGKGPLISPEKSLTLSCNNDQVLFENKAQCLTSGTGRRYDPETETLVVIPQITGTLCASGAGMSRPAGMASETDLLVCQVFPEPANTLLAKGNMSYRMDVDNVVVQAVDVRNLRETEQSGTLQAKTTGGYSLNYQNPVRVGYLVRRLTPIECERLQGFPDDWTAGGSDSARYKAIGNSIARPCVDWITGQIEKYLWLRLLGCA